MKKCSSCDKLVKNGYSQCFECNNKTTKDIYSTKLNIDGQSPACPQDGDESDEGVEKKIRKPRTEKQKEQFKKVMEAKMKNAEERKKLALIKAQAEKKELEDKLVKKAIAVKKKQIKKQKILDEFSDEDDEPVIEKMKFPPKPIVVSKYKFI